MSKFDEKTWRESRVTLQAQTPFTQYFQDTKPNYILITNRNETEVFLSTSAGVSRTEYSIKVPPMGRKLYSRPKTMTQVFLYQDSPNPVTIDLETWEGEFEASALSQSLDTVPLTGDQVLGTVNVGNFPAKQPVTVGNFPATQQVSGNVSVSNFPAFPAKQEVTGQVSVSNFPTKQEVTGNINVTNIPDVQKVDVNSYVGGVAIAASDTTDLVTVAKSLYVGGAGDIALVLSDGSDIILKSLPVGLYPFSVKRIKKTGTTATDLVALY